MGKFFEWDEAKNISNQQKHGVSFEEATEAFFDENLIIDIDDVHSAVEKRFYCYGMVNDCVMTVRFTYRGDGVRIFGAAYWRKGVKFYAKRNNI